MSKVDRGASRSDDSVRSWVRAGLGAPCFHRRVGTAQTTLAVHVLRRVLGMQKRTGCSPKAPVIRAARDAPSCDAGPEVSRDATPGPV